MKTINIGIFAHVDSGKTSIVEQLLYQTGCIKNLGSIKYGSTQMDSMDLEKNKGITIQTSMTSIEWKNTKINIIDTPGHIDFVGEVYCSLLAIDLAILVVTKTDGVKSHTKTIKKVLKDRKIPYILFVNKMDIHPYLDYSLSSFEQNLDTFLTLLNSNKESLSVQDIVDIMDDNHLLRLMSSHKFSYAFEGSARTGDGIIELLNGITSVAQLMNSSQPSRDDALSAVVFKVIFKEKKRFIYIRVLKGKLENHSKIRNTRTTEEVKIYSMRAFVKHNEVEVDFIEEDEVACIQLNGDIRVSDILGYKLEEQALHLSEPFLKVNINTSKDRTSLLMSALKQYTAEDPYLRYENINGECAVSLFGTTQLDILKERLEQEYAIDIEIRNAHIIEKCCPNEIKEQTLSFNDPSYYLPAGLTLSIHRHESINNSYIYLVDFGYLTKSYQQAVMDGAYKALAEGINDREVLYTTVNLVDAYYDSVSSTPAAFRNAAYHLISKMKENLDISILKPIVIFQLEFLIQYETTVLSNLLPISSITSQVSKHNKYIIYGTMKLEDAMNYQSVITQLTSGNGFFTFEFMAYE